MKEEYGQGEPQADFCYQSNFAQNMTSHGGSFDPFYRENHQKEQEKKFEEITRGVSSELENTGPVSKNVSKKSESWSAKGIDVSEEFLQVNPLKKYSINESQRG